MATSEVEVFAGVDGGEHLSHGFGMPGERAAVRGVDRDGVFVVRGHGMLSDTCQCGCQWGGQIQVQDAGLEVD